ncbi:MAG: alanine/ornithine racemase family PLP-dependent enzyme [Cycloclasticus sp.]
MSAPRLEVDLNKLIHNARTLTKRLDAKGISVTGVTKAFLGMPDIANTLLNAGIHTLGDSRIENIKAMHHAGINVPMMLIRSPMLSQVKQVVAYADISLNTELEVIRELSNAAQHADKVHGVVLMVELGDLREGIMAGDLDKVVRETLCLPNIKLKGIGTNLACRSGVTPDTKNMAELSALADDVEASFGIKLDIISGGNSANTNWVFSGSELGRINHLRLDEAILLGCEPSQRHVIEGLYTDVFSLVAEVIESKIKPAQAWGEHAQSAFSEAPTISLSQGSISQSILALGRQDTDPDGLNTPPGIVIRGASSDHLIIEAKQCLPIGSEVRFQPNYSALVRAMTSPFVNKVLNGKAA